MLMLLASIGTHVAVSALTLAQRRTMHEELATCSRNVDDAYLSAFSRFLVTQARGKLLEPLASNAHSDNGLTTALEKKQGNTRTLARLL